MNDKRQRSYPWQRRRRMVLLFLLGGVAVVVALVFVNGWRVNSRVAEQIQAIRDAGEPVTAEDMAQWTAPTPPDEKGAEAYQNAFDTKPEGQDVVSAETLRDKIDEAPEHGAFAEELHRLAKEHLEANTEKLRLLHEAAKNPTNRHPIDWSKGYTMPLSHLRELRDSARLLKLEAQVAAQEGDTARAVEAIAAAMALADSVREEPILISQLVRYACHGITGDALPRVLETAAFSDEQLSRLYATFRQGEDPEALARALIGERAMSLSAYEDPELYASAAPWMNEIMPGAANFVYHGLNITGWNASDQFRYMDYMEQLIETSRMPPHEALPAMDAMAQQFEGTQSWLPRMSDMLCHALSTTEQALARDAALLRSASAALAVERYRLAFGSLPEDLDELVPAFMDGVPIDPFDGQPLRYRPLDNGYVVYSVSHNQRDDAGTPASNNVFEQGDWAFRVER